MHFATLAIAAGTLVVLVSLFLTIKRAYERAPVRAQDRDTIRVQVDGKVISIDLSSTDSQRGRAIDDALKAVRGRAKHAA